MLGFYVTGHPLDHHREKIRELATHSSETLEGLAKGAEVALCGVVGAIQRRRNREGKAWASFQLEDLSGNVEAVVFASQYERVTENLVEDQAVFVRGLALPEENGPAKISVQDVVPLDLARVPIPSLISIRVWLGQNANTAPDKAAALNELFQKKPGETDVRLRLEKPRDFSLVLDVSAKVRPDREFREEVERICGPESVEVLAG